MYYNFNYTTQDLNSQAENPPKFAISKLECYKLTMDEGRRGGYDESQYKKPDNVALRVVQARPLGYRKPEPFIERVSRKAITPLLIALGLVGAAKALPNIQPAWDQSRPGETQPYHQNTWADKVRDKLNGTLPYEEGERLRKEVMVVDGGQPPLEWINNEPKLSDSIEVYDGFPSPFNGRGEPVGILGRIKLGTHLHDVLMVDGTEIDDLQKPREARYGAFKVGGLQIIGRDGKPVDTNPDRIVAINDRYLDPVAPATQAPK